MKNFISVEDVSDPMGLIKETIKLKEDPYAHAALGKHKVLGMIFFNSSLRTRMSTARAAYNLGMKVITLNVSSDSWQLETEDGTTMDSGKAEHIKEAIPVMGSYCDILAVRSFPSLKDKEEDYQDTVIQSFVELAGRPVVNLESAILHPLQSLADLVTIEEFATVRKPKVVLTWAPHIKPLPQSVANSFAQWMNKVEADLTIAHPEGLDLDAPYVEEATVTNDQGAALKDADFVYVKNWSSVKDYGKLHHAPNWMLTKEKLAITNQAKMMHCLPVRRNVVIADDALDSDHSIVQEQAANRLWSAQVVLKKILETI